MNGIDISGHQLNIDLAAVPCDFVIIKATQGTSFVSKDFKRQVEQALSLGKLTGVYHYANGAGINEEINHFVDVIYPYLGNVILCPPFVLLSKIVISCCSYIHKYIYKGLLCQAQIYKKA